MNKRLATQIIDHAKACITMVNLDPQTASEAKGDITTNLVEIIQLATRMDARTGTIDPNRKRTPRKPATRAEP
jgi:hypothetical protein